ncbi:hypothetical protein SLS56_006351 [Neofusicoccum ribis]|uniref:Xylanolytic transcriptional activator regulatory domain-containing protein n=1 Tax=Neofusicoccum ribis TaxID=45134 RepID=A0ABR3SR20_9PEZI
MHHLGLNRDPSHIKESAPAEAEVRRRVWATTVELLVQASIDSGQTPLISTDDFDCERPSDLDDFRTDDGGDQAVKTRKSAQNILVDSLPVRLQIAKFLNHFRSDLSYSTALSLSAQLTRLIRTHSSSLTESSESEKFQRKMVEFLTQRFLIPLHHMFAGQAKTSPAFYFSRRMCLDASLLVLNSTRPEPGAQLYRKLMGLGNGLYHITLLHAAVCIVLELMWQNDEASSLSSLVTQSSLLSQQEQKAAIRSYATLVRERLKKGQGNFKVYVLVGLAVAQLDNLEGEGAEESDLAKHMEDMLEECVETLAKTLPGRPDTQDNQGSLQAEELGDLDFNINDLPTSFDVSEILSLSDELFSDKDFWLFQS